MGNLGRSLSDSSRRQGEPASAILWACAGFDKLGRVTSWNASGHCPRTPLRQVFGPHNNNFYRLTVPGEGTRLCDIVGTDINIFIYTSTHTYIYIYIYIYIY